MLEPTTEEFNQMVCNNFDTNLKQIKKDVEVLKDWIRQQPFLPQSSSDTLLTTFLIACKNRMERAKEKIDNYYTVRMLMPHLFSNRDPEDERLLLNSEAIRYFILPKFTPDGYRVHWYTFVSSDPEMFDLPTFFKRVAITEDIRYNMESFTLGDYGVMDLKNVTANHLLQVTPTLARECMYCTQVTKIEFDAFPLRVKGVFLFNCPSYVHLALNIFKPFMKNKILKRIHVFKEGPEAFEKYIPKKMLPKDYGGEEDTSEKLQERWNELFREKRDWLMTEGEVTVDESKRIGDSKKKQGLYELQGSFKTLCVD